MTKPKFYQELLNSAVYREKIGWTECEKTRKIKITIVISYNWMRQE